MSRNYTWNYWIEAPRSVELYDLHTAVFGYREDKAKSKDLEFPPLLGVKYLEGGGYSGTEPLSEVSVWLWANRTKARRLKLILDRHFGTVGQLTRLDELTPDESSPDVQADSPEQWRTG